MVGTPPVLEEDAEAAWELLVFGVGEPPPPPHGDAESAAWIRAQLQELGFTQGTFARFMQRRGDVRSKRNIQRSIQRMCAGQVRVPGEMRVLLGLMLRSRQRRMATAARERDERNAPWNASPEPRRESKERDTHEAPRNHSSETRHRPEEQDSGEAPGGDSSEARSGPEERDGRDTSGGGLSGARQGDDERDADGAPRGHSSETRNGPEERDGRDAPRNHTSETRRGPGDGNGSEASRDDLSEERFGRWPPGKATGQ